MDPVRFDGFARAWGTASRRGALRLAAGAGLLGILAGGAAEDAAAKCVKPGKQCKKKNGKKKNCCGGAKCKGKKCVCPAGTFGCGKHCCLAGQKCSVQNNVKVCVNGNLPVGAACDPDATNGCASGVCGCNGNLCACREADCVGAGEECSGNVDCCQGACFVDICTGG